MFPFNRHAVDDKIREAAVAPGAGFPTTYPPRSLPHKLITEITKAVEKTVERVVAPPPVAAEVTRRKKVQSKSGECLTSEEAQTRIAREERETAAKKAKTAANKLVREKRKLEKPAD